MNVTLLAKTVLTDETLRKYTDEKRGKRTDQFIGTDAEKLTEIAGRTCYDSFGKGRSSPDYHRHIALVGHGSVLEHSSITLLISGCSRGFANELIRHRVGTAVSQRSTRYVDEDESLVIAHPLLKEVVTNLPTDEFAEVMQFMNVVKNSNRHFYRKMVNLIEKSLIEKGTEKQYARKQARGAARGYLENGMETELVFTMNLRAALNIIDQRARISADAEIREFAIDLIKICKEIAPGYFGRIRISSKPGIGKYVSRPKTIRF